MMQIEFREGRASSSSKEINENSELSDLFRLSIQDLTKRMRKISISHGQIESKGCPFAS